MRDICFFSSSHRARAFRRFPVAFLCHAGAIPPLPRRRKVRPGAPDGPSGVPGRAVMQRETVCLARPDGPSGHKKGRVPHGNRPSFTTLKFVKCCK